MFQDKLIDFCKLIFPDLYNIGSEIEKQTRNFVSNFLVAYLGFYDPKYIINQYDYIIGDISLNGYTIKEIRTTMTEITKLSKILPLGYGSSYDNIIVKFAIGKLYKGIYYKEKQFIASFTNAYLYKIGYLNKHTFKLVSGADLEVANNILVIMNTLDSICKKDIETEEEAVLI